MCCADPHHRRNSPSIHALLAERDGYVEVTSPATKAAGLSGSASAPGTDPSIFCGIAPRHVLTAPSCPFRNTSSWSDRRREIQSNLRRLYGRRRPPSRLFTLCARTGTPLPVQRR